MSIDESTACQAETSATLCNQQMQCKVTSSIPFASIDTLIADFYVLSAQWQKTSVFLITSLYSSPQYKPPKA